MPRLTTGFYEKMVGICWGKKEEEAKRPSADRRQWLVHGGGIPQLHVGGTIACRAAAEGQRYQRKQRTTTWRGRPHWVDGRCCHHEIKKERM